MIHLPFYSLILLFSLTLTEAKNTFNKALCFDTDPKCARLATQGQCQMDFIWMTNHCRLSCCESCEGVRREWTLRNKKYDKSTLNTNTSTLNINVDQSQLFLDPYGCPLDTNDDKQRLTKVPKLWNARNLDQITGHAKLLKLNKMIAVYHETCLNRTFALPSKYKDLSGIRRICHVKGNGTKNIVVLGNSHSFMSFAGLTHFFKPIAKSITLIATPVCTPTFENKEKFATNKNLKKRCAKFLKSSVSAIKKWNEPIDVIITIFGYINYHNTPINKDPSKDKMLVELQKYYNKLNAVARDKVILTLNHPHFHQDNYSILLKRLSKNEKIGVFSEKRKDLERLIPNVWDRLRRIKCKKCVKIDLMDMWCGRSSYCNAVDPYQNLSYFLDWHHPTSYGGMFMAKRVFEAYKHGK